MSRLAELLERRDARQQELDELVASCRVVDEATGEERDRELTEVEEKRSRKLLKKIDELDSEISGEKRSAERQRTLAEARKLVVPTEPALSTEVDEPRVYGKRSRHSWFADQHALVNRSPLDPRRHEAEARLMEWSHQVEREFAHESEAGRLAEKQMRSEFRDRGNESIEGSLKEMRERGRTALDLKVEQRAISTGGGATASAAGGGAAAFVSPVIFINEYAPFREAGRAFINQLHHQPLPDYGRQKVLCAA